MAKKGRMEEIYLMAAYLVSSSMIKLATIRKCKLSATLLLRLKSKQSGLVTIQMTQHPISTCPWCDFVGFFALTIKNRKLEELLNESDGMLPKVYLSRTDRPSLLEPVKLYDARVLPYGPRKHKLAFWIAQGVTKFYIYVHSMAPEVNALLWVYEKSAEVDVERVNWAPLPTTGDILDDNDPNLRIYRTEVVTSINDCVLRSRGHTRYLVSSDLDEIIVARKEASLLKMLDKE
ncbi:unnamed protein product, partial [Gongylonema pulchrum]|uniref:Glycosyltransferase family 92 protein n=1 Tax=Gongylonema pulchrum TaxID=637853 RepID=A0A183E7V0_9BILA